jgi:hypothetical protein
MVRHATDLGEMINVYKMLGGRPEETIAHGRAKPVCQFSQKVENFLIS